MVLPVVDVQLQLQSTHQEISADEEAAKLTRYTILDRAAICTYHSTISTPVFATNLLCVWGLLALTTLILFPY
jgi:hypothetical protein